MHKDVSRKCLRLERSFVWCWNVDTSESRSEILVMFLNVMLEKDGEDHLGRLCEWDTVEEERNVLHK
jgi:hypothetical protein